MPNSCIELLRRCTSYALSETEVTQGDYQTIIGSNPSSVFGVGTDYPVYYVSWYDAATFCNRLSTECGLTPVYNETTWETDFTKNGFYLPTEAQWEYAAGGPNHTMWSLGNTFDPSDYVYNDTQSRPVKSHPSNAFGLYDMSGNLFEWCYDIQGTFPHTGDSDPTGPIGDHSNPRIVKGGYWNGEYWITETPNDLKCEYRFSLPPDWQIDGVNGDYGLGFRVAVGGFGKW